MWCLIICLFECSFFYYSQIDLEPEGKVYVIIDLSGSSSEGNVNLGNIAWTDCMDPTDMYVISCNSRIVLNRLT